MNVLVVEDDDDKFELIKSVIADELGEEPYEVVRSRTVNDTFVSLGRGQYDVVIVDLVLPQMSDGEPTDATPQWCEVIENHLSGRTSSWIVMTGYSDVAEAARASFARHGVAVIYYDETAMWRKLLANKLRENFVTRPLDFVVICALEKERRGFSKAKCALGEYENIGGLDCQRVEMDSYRGVIAVLPSPGMISAAIASVKALLTFRPRAVAISGICGGRQGQTELGALIVPDVSWNYQSGKFVDGTLTADLLQVSIPPQVRTALVQLATSEHSRLIRDDLMHSELAAAPIQMLPMVSGSQVVADPTIGTLIGEQGRKVAGIDMEVASVLFAANDFYNGAGIFLAAKTVVDLADPDKDDRYHEYGCAVSARFVTNALYKLLS